MASLEERLVKVLEELRANTLSGHVRKLLECALATEADEPAIDTVTVDETADGTTTLTSSPRSVSTDAEFRKIVMYLFIGWFVCEIAGTSTGQSRETRDEWFDR